jgi:hypothetical protein
MNIQNLDARRPSKEDMARVGMKTFFKIMDLWGVKSDNAMVLIGRPGRTTFFKWKNGDVKKLEHDRLTRISYIVGIYKALNILYSDPKQCDEWIHRPNNFFGGRSAMDHMLGGNIVDIARVRERLDSVRGGWT